MRALLLDVGLGNDLGGEVEPLAEVVEALRGEGVVVYALMSTAPRGGAKIDAYRTATRSGSSSSHAR